MAEEILNDVEISSDNSQLVNAVLSELKQPNPSQRTEMKEEEEVTEATWWNTAYSVGNNILYVADFLGEVFAEFFGMTESRYQWAIDAYERQQRWDREEKRKEELHKKMALDEFKKQRKNRKKNAENEINQNEIKLSVNRSDDTFDGVTNIERDHNQEDQKEEEQPNLQEADANDPVQVQM
eukprot:173099_1